MAPLTPQLRGRIRSARPPRADPAWTPSLPVVPPPVPIPAEARPIHGTIVALLRAILAEEHASCCDAAFVQQYRRLAGLVDAYQHEVLARYPRAKTCHAGCAHCCHHWVEDVNSFEAAIIAQHVRDYYPDQIPRILQQLRADAGQLEALDARIREKRLLDADLFEREHIDTVDLLLSCFYQLGRPCPLLDSNRRCMVYDLRPLTCRIYISFGTPDTCKPLNINERPVGTYLLNLEEDAGALLDELHFRYTVFGDDTGLRSLLLKHLSETHTSSLQRG